MTTANIVNFAEITLNMIVEGKYLLKMSADEKTEKLQELIDHLDYLEESHNFFDVVIGSESYKANDNYRALEVLATCFDATNSNFDDCEIYEIIDLILEVKENRSSGDDFWIDSLPCGEVRCIERSAIDEIWTESLIDQIKDCYDLSNVPNFVAIDWEKTAENCKVDGMGHHFASYDGEEHFCNGLHIFRTN